MFSPGGVAGWLMLHEDAARRGEAWRLAPAYSLVAPALAAGLAGAVMIIELASRILAQGSGEGGPARFLGFSAASPAPWTIAVALIAFGAGFGRVFWPRVGDAWSAVGTRLRERAGA
jgi:branched-chain amino acid transport system permease protein